MTDNKFKYRMDPEFAPPQKKVPLLKSTYSDPNGGAHRQRPPPSREMNSRRNERKRSPTNSISGYSYGAGSNTHSTQYTTGAINNQIKKPSQIANNTSGQSVNSFKGGNAQSTTKTSTY